MGRLFSKVFFLFFSVMVSTTYAQVNGRLLDSVSEEPVLFAHIASQKVGFGTVSNENGEFQLPPAFSGDTLIISHIAYETLKIARSQLEASGNIKLTASELLLEEVVVTDVKTQKVMLRVLEFLRKSPLTYAKAFYRQVAFQDTLATEWIEAFYNTEYSSNGIERLKIDQARFARRKSDTAMLHMTFTNFSYLTVGNSIYAPETGESMLARPFALDFKDDFDTYLKRRYRKNNEVYLEIEFEPKANADNAIESYGVFTFNQSKGRLVQYTGNIDHGLGVSEDIEYEGDRVIAIEDPKYNYQFQFSESTGELAYITMDFSYRFLQDGVAYPSRVSSKLVFFQQLNKDPKRLREPALELEDVSNFEKAKYKPRFWYDNPIVKRTSEEEAIIATFEKQNAFGSYFK